MSDYPIEDDVPIPPKLVRSTMQFDILLRLKPGQSFAVPKEKDKAVRNAVVNFSKRHPEYQFTVRKLPDGRTRVWRLPTEQKAPPPPPPHPPVRVAKEGVVPPKPAAPKPALPGNGKARTVRGGRY